MTKKRIVRITLLSGAAISLFFVPWILIWAWILPLPNTVQEQVDEAIKHGLDGIIVYVDEASKPPAFYAAGWNDRENKIPADPHALFKIASISKLYIAATVAKLVSDKRLSLDNTLADYFPEFVGRIEHTEKITLRMLVQHRSGIPNFTSHPDYEWTNPCKNTDEILKLVLDKPAYFEPGEKYSYSNSNYLLIGEILDKTLGHSHHLYIKNEILAQLGLTHTFSLLSEVDAKEVVSGYDSRFEEDVKMLDHVSPSGSMVASAEDVGVFLRALNDGSLLNENEQTIYSSIYEFQHSGLLPGYFSIASYHEGLDAVVVQFVNTSGGYSLNLSEIVNTRIIKILRSKKSSK
jgi:D-alanyl-D-alanine carboxypeptidase